MSVYLKCLVDTVLEARADPEWWLPVVAAMAEHRPFSDLPTDVRQEVRRFIKDGKSATTSLSRLWTGYFKALENGHPETLSKPPTGPMRVENLRDWNQILQFNELALVLGGKEDDGLYIRDHAILDLGVNDVAVQLRRLAESIGKTDLHPSTVLAHDQESVAPALALADWFGCRIEPDGIEGKDCIYLIGNLAYAGALERARAMLEQFHPARTLVAALLITENLNGMRMLPDAVGYVVGSGALKWGRAAGLGVLLQGSEEEGFHADREAFAASRDRRLPEKIAAEIATEMKALDEAFYDDHVFFSSGALQRIIDRKSSPIQSFGWRMGEEAKDWYTMLPPFPQLFGTPFSEVGSRASVEELRQIDPNEDQLRFMDWVEPTLQNPLEVWIKEDATGQIYGHYFSTVQHPSLPNPAVIVVETVPHGEDLALNNFTLFLDPAEADELRFGRLAHSQNSMSLN